MAMSRNQEWVLADSQQENRHLSPITTRRLILPMTWGAWKWIFPPVESLMTQTLADTYVDW